MPAATPPPCLAGAERAKKGKRSERTVKSKQHKRASQIDREVVFFL